MIALLLTPLTIATLMSSAEFGSVSGTNVRLAAAPDTINPASSPNLPPPAIDTSIPMLNVALVKRLAAVKNELEEVAKKHPELGGGALGIAMQSRSYDRFENSEAFAELTKKHGFTVKQFFTAYSEVVGGLFILNVEKQLNQTNLLEAQGFKVIPPNKNFLIKNRKLIEELKLGDTYVGPKPSEQQERDRLLMPGSPMNPMNPEPDPMDPMDRGDRDLRDLRDFRDPMDE
jgi:hypothetical protein